MQYCIDCHFLAGMNISTNTKEITEDVRVHIRNKNDGSNEYHKKFYQNGHLCCFFNVWDRQQKILPQEKLDILDISNQKTIEYLKKEINQTPRENYCFFWKYRPGMSFEAAKVLQKRESNNREASIDRKHTKTSLRMAMVAIIVTAILGVANTIIGVFNCRKHDNHISFIKQVKQTKERQIKFFGLLKHYKPIIGRVVFGFRKWE